MTVDVSEEVPYRQWADLPRGDRVLVGGHTVWSEPVRPPLLVSQPNRWGVVEDHFPPVPCLVEADPAVTGHLPLPDEVVGFVDRAHHPLDAPRETETGRRLLQEAIRLSRRLTQIRGLKVAATPFARTIPILTPRDARALAEGCESDGVAGLRPLEGLGGGVALSIRPEHGPGDLDRIVEVLRHRLLG
ncbi:MAG: hypothetical protein ACLFWM_00450 [Actinomycetota bacterium]